MGTSIRLLRLAYTWQCWMPFSVELLVVSVPTEGTYECVKCASNESAEGASPGQFDTCTNTKASTTQADSNRSGCLCLAADPNGESHTT